MTAITNIRIDSMIPHGFASDNVALITVEGDFDEICEIFDAHYASRNGSEINQVKNGASIKIPFFGNTQLAEEAFTNMFDGFNVTVEFQS